MPRVVAAAAQQKTNTTVGAALLTDRASRTLIETQLRVALDAVCYQRGARERRRGNDGPFFFLSRRRSILNFETRAVDDDDDEMRDFEMQTSRDPPLVRNTIDAARSE